MRPPPLGPVHSQLLDAGVELHVHGIERVQPTPVLYVSAEEEKLGSAEGQGSGKGTGCRARETWV